MSTIRQVLFYLLIITKTGRLTEIRCTVCMSKSRRTLWISFSDQIQGCANTICSYDQTSISCTIPSVPPCREVFKTALIVCFHWGLSIFKSPQVFKTLLTIPKYFSYAVVRTVSINLLIYMSSNLLSRLFENFPRPRFILLILSCSTDFFLPLWQSLGMSPDIRFL